MQAKGSGRRVCADQHSQVIFFVCDDRTRRVRLSGRHDNQSRHDNGDRKVTPTRVYTTDIKLTGLIVMEDESRSSIICKAQNNLELCSHSRGIT